MLSTSVPGMGVGSGTGVGSGMGVGSGSGAQAAITMATTKLTVIFCGMCYIIKNPHCHFDRFAVKMADWGQGEVLSLRGFRGSAPEKNRIAFLKSRLTEH